MDCSNTAQTSHLRQVTPVVPVVASVRPLDPRDVVNLEGTIGVAFRPGVAEPLVLANPIGCNQPVVYVHYLLQKKKSEV